MHFKILNASFLSKRNPLEHSGTNKSCSYYWVEGSKERLSKSVDQFWSKTIEFIRVETFSRWYFKSKVIVRCFRCHVYLPSFPYWYLVCGSFPSLILILGVRHSRRPRFIRPYLKDLYGRRLAQGPEIYRPRKDWLCWNRDSELCAFLSRIGENLEKDLIEVVLTDR